MRNYRTVLYLCGGICLTFPVYIPVGPYQIHPHFLFETLAYFIGFRLYLWLRRGSGDTISESTRWWVVAGATVGAALGSKVLYWFEQPALTLAHLTDLTYLMAGKSIVGGLLGGLAGVELTKKWIGESRSTGDLFVIPLAAGMAIGRIGCFLTGLADHTHGVVTALPWGVDFGDGIARHPTQLYEMAALAAIALWAGARRRTAVQSGDIFKGFMILYLLFRFGVELIKPDPRPYLGLSGIQVACVGGLLYYLRDLSRVLLRKRKDEAAHG
ncbi:MAG: diacylglyceryl transferase [Symbiobacteriaceae bacterium]|nr:diacylglyceryl transferase [Symbiobacteriaceae bacterium]